MSIHGPIVRRLLSAPWRVVAVDDQRRWRAGAMLAAAVNLADDLSDVCRSPTLGVMLPTGAAFPVAALAGWMLGKTIVPLNYLLQRDELESVIGHSGVDTIVTAGPLLDHMKFEPAGARLVRLESLSLARFPAAVRPVGAEDDDLAALLYTSGTSGRPKGVMLTHGNLRANIRQIQRWIHFTRADTLFGVLPQFHSFGFTVLTLLPLTVGCRVEYAARFTPARIVRRIRESRPSVIVAIPSMYHALLSVKDAQPEDFASLRLVVAGGEPLPRTVYDHFRERFRKEIREGYGLTETAPVTNWLRPWEGPFGTVGMPLPGVEEKIVSLETGRPLGPNADGEVRIKGPNVMKGYYRDAVGTRRAFDDEGYFRTGDIGRFDLAGRLAITGREKEMMIVGGENVFPREIEDALCRHGSVRACGVIGVPHPLRGEEPVAFVELTDDADFDEHALRAFCRSQLASYKAPRRIHALESLPKGPTGKVLRRALRDLLSVDDRSRPLGRDAQPTPKGNAQERTRTSTP